MLSHGEPAVPILHSAIASFLQKRGQEIDDKG
jgi:hypothetical protein